MFIFVVHISTGGTEIIEIRLVDYFFNIGPFIAMKIDPKASKFAKVGLEFFQKPNKLSKIDKNFYIFFYEVAKFDQIWSHW